MKSRSVEKIPNPSAVGCPLRIPHPGYYAAIDGETPLNLVCVIKKQRIAGPQFPLL